MRLGIAISLISKASALAVQLVAVPFGIAYCGLQQYTQYVTLVALSMLPAVLLLRLGPSFTAKYASAYRRNNRSEADTLFAVSTIGTTAHVTLATVAALLVTTCAPLQTVVDPSGSLGAFPAFYSFTLFFIAIAGGVFTGVEAAQAGAHETHLLATRSVVANLASFACIVIVTPLWNNIFTFVLALQIIPFSLRAVNAIFFIARHHPDALVPRKTQELKKVFTSTIKDAWVFTLLSGPVNFLALNAPILLFAAIPDERLSAWLIVAMTLLVQAIRGMSLALGPVVPAIADAHSSGNSTQVRKYKSNLAMFAIALGAMTIACAMLVSPIAIALDVNVPPRFTAIAVPLAFFAACLFFESTIATTVYALGDHKATHRVYAIVIARSVIGFSVIAASLRPESLHVAFVINVLYTLIASIFPILSVLGSAQVRRAAPQP